ncbi:MAG TPA: hypothetical protein VHV30_16695 [Polyangiaceae bacterium]|jgi:hypothetical protein|nr:hypothetical protein [Polyangiaceae bacterium]
MKRVLLAAFVAGVAALAPAPASAQPKDDAARADAAFAAGKKLLEQNNLAEACAHFAESKRLGPAVGVTLYLADCYQRLGKLASAYGEFQSAEALARAKKDKRAELAHRRAQALEPRLERLTVHVTTTASTMPEVSLDGRVLPPDAWETSMPVDPGDHVVVARQGTHRKEFDVHLDAERPVVAVTVDPMEDTAPAPPPRAPAPPPPAAAPTAPAEAPDAPAPAPPSGDATRTWTAVSLLGVGVAGVVVGSVFGLKAISDRSASNNGPCNAADRCDPHGLSLRDDAIDEARVSTVGFIVGVAGLGASAVVAFVLPGASSSSVAVSAGPLPGGASAAVRGTF